MLVITAVACHYVAVAFFAMPRPDGECLRRTVRVDNGGFLNEQGLRCESLDRRIHARAEPHGCEASIGGDPKGATSVASYSELRVRIERTSAEEGSYDVL